MDLIVRTNDLELSEALSAFIDRKVDFAVKRYYDEVGRIVVRLADLNGPRGGVDKRCTIVLSLRDGATLVVSGESDDAYAAVAQAAARLDAQIARHLRRTWQSATVPHR
jgi:ribosomal subunit interface protein